MGQAASRTLFPIEFPAAVWSEEVERYASRSPKRQSAERARREIEAGRSHLNLLRCEAEGREGTSLPNCWKGYVPIDALGASAAPFGFVFRLMAIDGRPTLRFLAFGERHPGSPRTKSVYERAHKRLHGRYP
jgi:hypothetical protein